MDDRESRIARVQWAYRMASLNHMPEQNAFLGLGNVKEEDAKPDGFQVGSAWYKLASLPILEAAVPQVEEALKKREYRVLRTPALQDATNRLQELDMRPALKALATSSHGKVNPEEWIEGMRMMASWTEEEHCPRIFWTETPSTLFIFRAASEEEILAKFAAVKDKKRMPTPDKVLGKMVLLRLQKLRCAVDDTNKSITKSNKYAQQFHALADALGNKGYAVKPLLQWTNPDSLEAWSRLKAYLDQDLAYHRKRPIKELDDLIEEKGIKDVHFKEACEILLVADVMDA